jgi:hypothetical protein
MHPSHNESEVKTEEAREPSTLEWHPVWLGVNFLIAVAVIFAASIAALLLLLYFAGKADGLALLSTNHFSWTYGPTAVLTLAVAAWRQIDYCNKAQVPWNEMLRGDAPASKSILLDYKSPLQIVSLYNSAKHKHINVSITILGFFVLKLVTLASTGLLSLESVTLPPTAIQLTRTTRIDGSLYNDTENQGLFDPSIAYTAFAVMTDKVASLPGTAPHMVFEQYKLADTLRAGDGIRAGNETLTARVKALIPKYHCESTAVSIRFAPQNTTDQFPPDRVQLLSPRCTLRQSGAGTPLFSLNPERFACPPRQLSPLLQQIDCNSEPGNWQLLTLADYRYSQTLQNDSSMELGSSVQPLGGSKNVNQMIGIACKSDFTYEEVDVRYLHTAGTLQILNITRLGTGSDSASDVKPFNGSDLGVLATSALSASADMFGNLVDNSYVLEYPQAFFKMMAATTTGTYESLLNETVMIAAAETVFNEIALQAASKFVVANDTSPLTGTSTVATFRLQISDLAAWSMVAGCFLMFCFTLCVVWSRLRIASPSGRETLSSMAQLLFQSEEVTSLLKSVASGSEKTFSKALDGHLYSLHTQCSPEGITLLPAQPNASGQESPAQVDDTTDESSSLQWWRPLTLRRPILVLSLALPLLAICLLEVLQQLSDRRQGFVSIASLSSLGTTIYTRFIPALGMLFMATLVNALDFNIAVLSPFNALKAGKSRASHSINENSLLGCPAPIAIWQSFRNRQWDVCLIRTNALIASVLTIIVSGLYTVDGVQTSSAAILRKVDAFTNTSGITVKFDNSAAIVSSLIESIGLDYPRYTYEELAFPTLQLDSTTSSSASSGAGLQTELDVIRADLRCESLPPQMVNASASYNYRIETAQASVFARARLPAKCPFGGANGNDSTISFSNSFTLSGNASFVGKLLDLHVGPFDPIKESSAGEISANTQSDNPPGCPSLAFIYGYVDANQPAKMKFTTLVCYQYLDSLQTNVAFSSTGFDLPSGMSSDEAARRVVVDESSATRIKVPNSKSNETAFQFRLQLHMDDQFSSFNQSVTSQASLAASSNPLDNFFQGVLFGRTPMDQDLLASQEPEDVSQVFGGIRAFYRRYMAQAISSTMRVPVPIAAQKILNATVTDAISDQRVFQNRTAKLILQVQLGVIFILTGLAMYFAKLREIVPFNPCTIAGTAVLFANSRMCDPSDDMGMDIMGNGGIGFKDGNYKFRLGWWYAKADRVGEGQKWYGIDATKVDDGG